MNRSARRKHVVKHIDKRLRLRFRIYILLAVILLGFLIFDLVTVKIHLLEALLGIAVGAGVGVLSSRMFHISWSHDAKKVISQLDVFGGVILALYILFEFRREWLVSIFIHGPELGTVSFAVLTGVMIGRLLGTQGRVIQILKEQKVF